MEYGTAAHKALQLHYSGASWQDAIAAAVTHYSQPDIHVPEEDWRCTAHLVNLLMQYGAWWKEEGELLQPLKDKDGKALVERKFAYPLMRTDRVEVLLCGTIDLLATHVGIDGRIVVVDHKTTSLVQVDAYMDSYTMSPQLMTYLTVYEDLFPEYSGNVCCMINGLFLSRSNKNTFRRSPLIEFTPRQLVSFKKMMLLRMGEVVRRFESWLDNPTTPLHELFPYNFTCCEQWFGMCEMKRLCSCGTDDEMESIVSNDFKTKQYNPLMFQT